ncbi:MAG: hypothetical protein ACOZDD_06885 [Bacteroidota bacterium]
MKQLFLNRPMGIIALFLAVLLTGTAFGQNPDFSGKWKLNTAKSKLNPEFSMAPKQLNVEHKGNNLSLERMVEFQGQSMTISDKFTLDGKECINEGFQGSKKKSVVSWSEDKKSMIIKTKFPMQDGGEISITETIKLDSGTLNMVSAVSSDWGDMSETHVFDKM